MSDDSDQEALNYHRRKGKRQPRIEDSDSSSDSSFERGTKRKRVPRVLSDRESSVSDGDSSPIMKPASKKRVPRVMSEEERSSDEESDWDDESSGDEGVNAENASEGEEEEDEEDEVEGDEEEDDSESGSEESGNSSYSDWESEEDFDTFEEEAGATSQQNRSSSKTTSKTKSKVSDEAAGASSVAAASYMSDSSDGQSEKCPICLRSFTTQEIGTPESCDHSFCVDCLQEWSKNVNTCPVDRQVFTLILVRRCLEGKVIRKIPIEPPRRQDEEEVLEDPTYCEVCGECDREDRMLLCDGCDLGYHLECLDPPMETVPMDEWFCPDCIQSNTSHLAEEVDIQDGELVDLIEDAYAANFPPLRPRVSRLMPRTRQSERVRATVMTRQRQRNAESRRDPAQPSTSSGFDSLEVDSTTSVSSTRQRRTVTSTPKTTRKRRKTTRRKTTKRKTTKRKKRRKTTASKKPKSTSLSDKTSSKGVSKRRKKRRKTKRKKRKISRKIRRPARFPIPHSVKGRLAEHLGVCPPRRPGQTIPDVRPRVTSSRIDFQRSQAGIPTLHLFGQRDQLDYFSSGSDHEDEVGGGDIAVIARPRALSARSASAIISRKRVFPSTSRSLSTIHSSTSSNLKPEVSDKSSCDLIGSILNSQAAWHSKKSVVTLNRDGSLQIKSEGGSETPKKNKENNRGKSDVNRTEGEPVVRTDDRLSQISNSGAPLNVSEAGSSTSGHITQTPMYPGRGGGGSARPPPGGNFQQFGGNRYSNSPSYHSYQGGRGYSNFPPSSSFDSRGARAGYANYLNSGPPPPPPFRGGLPLRFRMAPRFPIRRPLLPPVRPQLQQQAHPQQTLHQISPSGIEDFQPDDDEDDGGDVDNDAPDSQKPNRQEDEDEEIDIYSDIEVGGGSGSGGQGGGGSEPDDGDRNLEQGYDALPPPPAPPALLMGMGGDGLSDEEPGSDSELVIDDNIVPSSPPDGSEKYDPEDTADKPSLPEIPESEKYDPADPSNDTDDEEEPAAVTVSKATEALTISVPPPSEICSLSNVAHSSSNSNASYLHSPTYGDSSMLGSDIKLPPESGLPSVAKEDHIMETSTIVNRETGGITNDTLERHSIADDDEEEEDEECPNFSIYSAASMDIARRTGEDENIPDSKTDENAEITEEEERVDSDIEKEDKSIVDEDKDENSNVSGGDELNSEHDYFDKEPSSSIIEDKDSEPPAEPEEGELSDRQAEKDEEDEEEPKSSSEQKLMETDDVPEKEPEQNQESAEGIKKLSLVEEIFGSDDNDSLIGGATSAVSAATIDNAPQASVTPLGLEGLDTETISETEEAINFEDDISQDDGFLTAEEDGEIPSVKRKKKKKNRKLSAGGSVGEEVAAAKDQTPQEPIDYEEGEIVDDRPKPHETSKKDKKSSEKKDKSKYDKDTQKSTDENFDVTAKSKTSEEERKKKKKKSSGDKSRLSKERAVLSSSENKDKNKEKGSKGDDSNIAWKKLSKSSKERNYRDTKGKPDADAKTKDGGKKKDTSGKESLAKKDKKKKEKRKDMERYDVRKIVTDKKRKRRDAFGRDLSRERSFSRSRSRSRSRGRSYDRSRRSRSISRSRITRSRGRSPIKSRVRSRSRSRFRSRSRSRNRSRSRSKNRTKIKSKDRLRKSRSKEKQRSRISRSRSRGRRSRTRSRSRSRNRSRGRSRSRSPVRSRDRRDRRDSQKCRYRERRSWSHSWTASFTRSRSLSCSSYSRSRTPSVRRFNRSYSHSFSRSWSRERHERIPVIEKKSGAISKTAKKLTVIVPNTKEDSDRHRKKEKKRKEAKKNKEALAALEKRKKRKEKSPAPSKEVFTSGDNILVSVNFKSNKNTTNKDVPIAGAISGPIIKEMSKRKHDGSFEIEREPAKKPRKEKGKDKGSPRQKNGISGEKILRSGEKKKKALQKTGSKVSRVAALVNKKPVAIIDLDQSPFHEQTPSPTDLIVLSDSDEEGLNKEGDREEESLTSLRNLRPSSTSPKQSSKQGINVVPSNAISRTPESQSPPMNAVGSYLVTSTGPKTPPEPQIKFSIAVKPQLRSITNPLREDEEDLMAEDGGLDDLDQRIEEELDRGLDRGLGEMIHKGPNTPPEPRGPTTPCSSPTSPDAYDPFDPTKSGTPSPVGAGASMDGPPSPVHTSTEQLMQHAVIGRESPMVSDLEDLASKSLEARVTTPTIPLATEEAADQSSQSPDRSKLSVRGENTLASSPSIIPETTSLPPPVSSDNEISQPAELAEGSEKTKQMAAGPAADANATQSPERTIPVVITSQPPTIQGTPVKPLFPNSAVKQVAQQQPITSTPTHSAAPTPVFPTLTPASIASILCTPPPSSLPLGRMALFNAPAMAVPQLLVPQQQSQQQQPQQQQTPAILIGSPVIVAQRPPPNVVRTTPEKPAPSPAKVVPVRANTVQNGEQTQTSQKQPPDTSTDVVDMDLESPYSPGSSEGDDLFDPPAEVKSSSTTASFTALGNRTVPQPNKNSNKLPLPLVAMLHKSPSKPPAGQDKFDSIFGLSPLRLNKTAPARTGGRMPAKAHHNKGNKSKGKHDRNKGGKKEIAIKMDEDQLQILDDLPSSAVELQVKDKFLKKLNRQERVVEEVKLSLKPHYTKKHISKEEYKEILRRSVPKICHNKSGEINPIKIGCLVEAYVKKYRYAAKKKALATGKTKPNKTTMWS